MRLRVVVPAVALTAMAFALPVSAFAEAVKIPFFGPIVPEAINYCPASFAMFVDVINRIILFSITIAITIVAPLMIAYAGFLMVVNPFNADGIKKAKSIMLNTVVGIVIALAGWLIVNAVMVALTPNDGRPFGTRWSEMITTGGIDPCLVQAGALQDLSQTGAKITGSGADGGLFLSLPTNANCAPDTLMNAAAAGGYTLTQAQANTLSCIAVPESSCGKNISGATQVDGTPTSASGMFQVVMGYNDTCHNLNIPICTQAAATAGYNVSGNLNCSQAFKGGRPKPGMESQARACQAASANLACNTSAAACLVKAANGKFNDWTADSRSATQKNCVTKYAGG